LTADVTVPQFNDRHFTANFLAVARGFDPNTRTVVAEFTIENQDHALWPGSYATVNLTTQIDDHVLVIPSSSLVFDDRATQVAVVTADQRIHFKPIKVSKLMDAAVEVVDGISSQDQIVDNPSAALLEGDKVRVVTPAPGYGPISQTAGKPKPKGID
jgi:multidrug efflux pump subunit AcrA (membrane-fusion protein)